MQAKRAHGGTENAEDDRSRSGSEAEKGRHVGRGVRAAGIVGRRWRTGPYSHVVALLCVGSLVARSCALPSDAPWGNTWSDGAGVLASEVLALATFYDCTVAGDDIMYDSLAACSNACHAGTCEQRTTDGHLSTPELVTLHPNTTHEREVVLVALSPVVHVEDEVQIVIKAVDATLSISVQEDPGLPIGMLSSLNDAKTELTVVWTPRVGQEGLVHEVHAFNVEPCPVALDLDLVSFAPCNAKSTALQSPVSSEMLVHR